MREITIALCGANGFGLFYVENLLEGAGEHAVRFVACVDTAEPRKRAELENAGVRIFTSLEAMYDALPCPDLVIVSTPIGCHSEHTLLCLSKGSHVLCEKPVASTVEDARAMQAAADEAGLILSIGYQWSYSPAIQELKRLVMSGALGESQCLKTLVMWPRTEKYYGRNAWAGAIKDERGGWVLDSPVMNAVSHYLHNALYVLGDEVGSSASFTGLEAELFRAYPIENYDTAALRMKTPQGATVLFYTTHVAKTFIGPMLNFRFDRATVTFADYNLRDGGPNTGIVVRHDDGRVDNLGNPFVGSAGKIWQTVDAIREGGETPCGAGAATPHLEAVHAAQRFPIKSFGPDRVERLAARDGTCQLWVPGLEPLLVACYDQEVLPSELNSVL